MTRALRFGAPIVVASLLACSPAHSVTTPTALPPLSAVTLPGGAELGVEALAALLGEVDVVYVGERHDAAADHAAEAALIRLTRPTLVGMEMFQRPFQAGLDAYARGEIDEAELVGATEWAERWGMPFEVYADVVRATREVGARIVALNAPREWTRAISRSGLEGVTPEIRALLPELDLTNAPHRAMVMEALSGHAGHGGGSMDPAMLVRFYVAQTTWDEAMGESVATALEGGGHMLVVAGRMHVQRGLGIPRCAARRRALSHQIVLPLTAAEIEAERATPTELADIAIRVAE